MNAVLIVFLALVVVAAIATLEWRRHNRLHRATRVGASVAAVAALALLGVFGNRDEPQAKVAVAQAALWTPTADGATSASADVPEVPLKFALPGVTPAPDVAIVVRDVAYVRRHHPQIGSLRIVGDGLEPHNLDALEGLEVTFAGASTEASRPTLAPVNFPRSLAIGENLMVQGAIIGLRPGETVRVSIDGPGGSPTAEIAATGDAAGAAPFTISAGSPPGEGQYVWRLKISGDAGPVAEERLGVAVVRPTLPRVLVLESSPRLETSHLRRWFGEMRGVLRARTLVGRERYRFASTESAHAEFAAVDPELLNGCDILIADVQALTALSPSERGAVRDAIARHGLGLLLFGGSEPPKFDDGEDAAFFFPWKTSHAADESPAAENEARAARLQWTGLAAPLDHPVQVEHSAIEASAGETRLVTDSQSRALVTSIARGRGQIALSLVRDTWRWRLEEQSAAFASYWSFLLGHLAKAQTGDHPRWAITTPSNTPLVVNQPVSLCYSTLGSPTSVPEITSDAEGERVALSLSQDAVESQNWRTTFWPRRTGWHRVRLPPDGVPLDFFVHDRDEWTSVGPARRRAVTAAFAARSKVPASGQRPASPSPRPRIHAASTAGLFAVFFLSCGYLWLERRRLA